MSDEILKAEIEFIETVSHELEVVVENIRHISIDSGVEVIGEIMPSTMVMDEFTNDVSEIHPDDAEWNDTWLVANAVRVMTDSYVGDSGVNTQFYFTNYNVCSDEPYTNFKKHRVNLSRPNHTTILNYLETLHQVYNPEIYKMVNLDDISDEQLEVLFTNEVESKPEEDNIIPFAPYLQRKQLMD